MRRGMPGRHKSASVHTSDPPRRKKAAHLEESQAADVDRLGIVIRRVVASDSRLGTASELAHEAA